MTAAEFCRDMHVSMFNELPSANCAVQFQCKGSAVCVCTVSVLTGGGGNSYSLQRRLSQRKLSVRFNKQLSCKTVLKKDIHIFKKYFTHFFSLSLYR